MSWQNFTSPILSTSIINEHHKYRHLTQKGGLFKFKIHAYETSYNNTNAHKALITLTHWTMNNELVSSQAIINYLLDHSQENSEYYRLNYITRILFKFYSSLIVIHSNK